GVQAERPQRRAPDHFATPAPVAVTAIDDRVDGGPLAWRGFGDALADRRDHPSELVPEHDRGPGSAHRVRRADRHDARPVLPLLEVGAADATPAHPELDLAGPWRRRWRHLFDPHVAPGVPAHSLHVIRLRPAIRRPRPRYAARQGRSSR